MAISIGLIYSLILILNFTKRNWPINIRRILTIGHTVFIGLTVIQMVLLSSSQMTFRGIYSDRIIFWGLFITGGLFFSLFKGKSIWSKIYFGTYFYYPIIALTTFFIDRIMFVLIASPLLISLQLPEIYYHDAKLEIRSNTGLMTSRKIILIEKNWLTEKEIGGKEHTNEGTLKIKEVEIINTTANSINARLNYGQRNELVTFATNH